VRDGFCHRCVIEDVIATDNYIHFFAVLVDRVYWLGGRGRGELNLKDYINPGVALPADCKVRVLRMRRAGIEEKRGIEVLVKAIAGVTIM